MSGDLLLRQWTRPARVRGSLDVIALGLPAVLAVAAIAYRIDSAAAAVLVALAGSILLVGFAWWHSRRFGRGWLVLQLDAVRADVEDSADLLFADTATLRPLQLLQRTRVAARLADAPPTLLPARSRNRLAGAWLLGMIVAATVLLWPNPPPPPLAPSAEGVIAAPGIPRLVGQRLRIVPPAYTGLPPRDLDSLDARAPQGSRLIWTLAFAPPPQGASLTFLDGRHIALASGAEGWRAATLLDRAALYRVVPTGARQRARLHRLDAVPDRAPSVVVRSPTHTLTIAGAHQARWALLYEATDDYGVAPVATLRITVASGEGEQISFREHVLTLRGTGPARRRHFAASLDLAALGFSGPGDLVAEFGIADTRAPAPQTTRAPTQILRRLPAQPAQATGLDGAVRAALPAYLRSQRQVINDAQDLLAQRRALPADRFAAKSQSIGGDQHALRLHYGEFLGQENEGHELPTADAPPASPVLGREEDVLGDYGHKHDDAESATLFDPETKARLSGAVEQMWQSELALNQGDPARALPFANRALVLIKQVQQATRVFIARVGTPELPPIDESRRLTGLRDGVAPGDLTLPAIEGDDGTAARVWASVAGGGTRGLAEVARWSRSAGARGGDPLALAATLDAVQREPGCKACRDRLRALVWQALQRPTPGVARRADPGKAGARYLDAIGAGR